MIDDRTRLVHIRGAIERAEAYTSDGRVAFFAEQKTQDAVVRMLEVIGEAAKNLSDALRSAHADVPWRDISRMRDKLIHHYFGVKLDRVWQTVEADVAARRKAFAAIAIGTVNNTSVHRFHRSDCVR